MYNTINLQIISAKCPNGMNRGDCPVQKYIDNTNVFHTTINETLIKPMKPYLDAREEYIAALDTIHQLCADCQSKNR